MGQQLFELRGFVAESLREQGRKQGRKQAWEESRSLVRTSLLARLDQKGLTLTRDQLDLVHETQDLGVLTCWHTRVLHATAPDEIFTCE